MAAAIAPQRQTVDAPEKIKINAEGTAASGLSGQDVGANNIYERNCLHFNKATLQTSGTMAKHKISGIWKGENNVITHYALHAENANSTLKAAKTSKANTISLLETSENSAVTLVWNYSRAGWDVGENVEVVNGPDGKFLRSNPGNRLTDNLGHLIDFDWIDPNL